MTRDVDVVIAGSGFGGSIMAMIARRLGLSVALLERGQHPRMAIGESSTPLSNLLLERLSRQYDLPRLLPLAKWGSWQRAYPHVACGLKRGFSFFHQDGRRLVVAASPHDAIADTHWYRSDVDHFLVQEAQQLGVDYRDRVCVGRLDLAGDSINIEGQSGDAPFHLRAGFLIDATGPRGFLHNALRLPEDSLPGFPDTECLYSHFTGVARTPLTDEMPPFPVDDAAVHHVFDAGWVWVLRFNNGITSAGVAAKKVAARELALEQGELAWQRLLERLPALKAQFAQAKPSCPFRHMPAVSFRSPTIAGPRWAMLPSAAGFADPLLSTGFALNLLGIDRLARVLPGNSIEASEALEDYAAQTGNELLAASRLIGALYATMSNFSAFTAVSLLYFAAVSYAETAYRLGKPDLAPGFLLYRHPQFGPASRTLFQRAHTLHGEDETRAFAKEVVGLIEPFDVGGFAGPLREWYPVRAEDLLKGAHKLGASREEIPTMLEKAGFFASTPL